MMFKAFVSGDKQILVEFQEHFIDLLKQCKEDNYKAIRFTIPKEYAIYTPIALEQNFTYHHTTSQELVMTREFKEGGNDSLPSYATQTVGIFCLVIDSDNVLVIIERYKPELGYKLPGGRANYVEHSRFLCNSIRLQK